MNEQVNIDRWIDMDSEEFKQIEDHARIYRFTLRAIELDVLTIDGDGKLFTNGKPCYAEHGGKCVGLRYCKKAVN